MNRRKRPPVDACFFPETPSPAEQGSRGSSIPLILFEEGGFRVNEQAVDLLSTWEPPLAVVAVAGLYRTGKSFLLNRVILGGGGKFVVGPTTRACTKGIWMWSEPIVAVDASGKKTHVLVVDTEGIGAPTADATHDTRIFALGLLLSSYFIYNSVGSIDEQALSNMSLVTNLSKEIRGSVKAPLQDEDEEAEEETSDAEPLRHSFPAFLWVVRDFALQLRDADGRAIGAKEYLEDALKDCAAKGAAAAGKNRIRSTLRSFFPERDCFTMVRPCTDEGQLQLLDTLPDSQLRPEFLEQARELKQRIVAEAQRRPLKVNECELSGSMLGLLCRQYVEAINRGQVPVIQDAWSYVCDAQRSKTEAKLVMEFQTAITALPKQPDVVTPSQFALACTRLTQSTLGSFEATCKSLFPHESVSTWLDDLETKLRPITAAAVGHFQTSYVATLHKAVVEAQREVEGRLSRQEFASLPDFRRALHAAHSTFITKYVEGDMNVDEGIKDSANAAWFLAADTLTWRTVQEFNSRGEAQLSSFKADAERLQHQVHDLTKSHAAALSALEKTLREEVAAAHADAAQKVTTLQSAVEEAAARSSERAARVTALEEELLLLTESTGARCVEMQQTADRERLRAEAAERKVVQLKEDLVDADEQLARMEQVTRELEQVKLEYKRLGADLAETRRELEEQRTRQREMEASFKKQATEMHQKALQSLETMKEKRNSAEGKLRAKQEKCARLEEKCSKLEERERHLDEELKRSTASHAETAAQLEQRAQQLRGEVDESRARLRAAEEEKEREGKERQSALELAKKEAREEVVRLGLEHRNRITALETRARAAEDERDSLKRELEEATADRERAKRMRRDDSMVPRAELVTLQEQLAGLQREKTATSADLGEKNKRQKQKIRELEEENKRLNQTVMELELRQQFSSHSTPRRDRGARGAYSSESD